MNPRWVIALFVLLCVNCEHTIEDLVLEAIEENSSEDLVQALAQKPDINYRYPSGDTALLAIVRLGRDNLINYLLENESLDIHHHEYQHHLPILHYAAKQGRHTIVAMLLKHGCNMNEFDPDGYLPFHHAALGHDQDHLETLKTFVHMGADASVETTHGTNALHLAHWAPIHHYLEELLVYPTEKIEGIQYQDYGEGEEAVPDAAADEEAWQENLEELQEQPYDEEL
eukprot:TRINITY_DN60366_c0_g1_i1.p1 TRINITY_DN60366_c0_g1~~TRINITY_DN60366_c0_g1_i1.p1  ORF type:complete len:227 (+),score=17.65 TRINITY_DN60366_c0_g1_i1:32-712(+)